MLSPSPSRLLSGVADALDETVLPTMARGPGRDQVQAAIGIVRRCAAAVDMCGPVLHAECTDLSRSLRSISGADVDLIADQAGFEDVVGGAEGVLAGSYPSVPTLIETALSLHSLLADVAVAAERQQSDQRGPILDLFDRMITRQHEIGLSPW